MVARHDAIMNIKESLYKNGMSLIVTPFPSADNQNQDNAAKDTSNKTVDNHQNANA